MSEHGGDIYSAEYDNIIDFSANVSPFGLCEEIKSAITNSADSVANYPDPYCRKLRQALSKHHGIKMENIICGNGGADVIFRLVGAKRPKKAIIMAPTFSEYEKALEEVNCDILYYMMDSTFTIKSDLLDMIDESVDMIFICNPNNPTGILTEISFIEEILSIGKKTLVVIDECFNDMIDNPEAYSMISKIHKYKNLFILRSLTKLYALAGLRIGYGISSNAEFIEKVRKVGQPWSVSTLASEAGAVAVACKEYRERVCEFIKEEKKYLYEELKNLGLYVIKPAANYLFFKACGVYDLERKILPFGIMIRSCKNYRNLGPDYYRVAVKLRNENELLIAALKKVLR
ncbi:MAG: aminotransferase class I/II-fold pyridoxal phosphate-dependent enzyme [Clostridia bacterium]|nr:aminotransferase class I/II-fold pyridoxal phosphate-dependent enzyme [Clostridia bacterium]